MENLLSPTSHDRDRKIRFSNDEIDSFKKKSSFIMLYIYFV